jgi:hypothetical protein
LIVSKKKSSNKDNILTTFEDDFIKEWANGVEKNIEVFMYKNNSYYTEGGSRVK